MPGMAMEWREADGVRWLEAELSGASVAFSTRLGGVSEPPFDQLNLGILTGDERAAVLENRSRLAAALGLDPGRILMGLQVHGAELLRSDSPQDPSPYAQPGSPLAEVARRQLRDAGVERIESAGICTSCEPELFYSHRRDGKQSGRQAGLVWTEAA